MKILHKLPILFVCIAQLSFSQELSDKQILQKIISFNLTDLIEFEEEIVFDKLVSYSIDDTSDKYCKSSAYENHNRDVKRGFPNYLRLIDRKKIKISYLNKDGRSLVFNDTFELLYNKTHKKYEISCCDNKEEPISRFGEWNYSYDGVLYETQIYNDRGVLETTKGIDEEGNVSYVKTKDTYSEYFSDGTLNYKVGLRNDRKYGEVVEYHEDKKTIKRTCTYTNGQRVGVSKEFFENGSPKEQCTFNNGKMVGDYISYIENGDIKEKGKYKYGEKDGDWIVAFETENDFDFPYLSYNGDYIDASDELQIGDYFQKLGRFKNGEARSVSRIQYTSGEELIKIKGNTITYFYRNGNKYAEGKVDSYGDPKGQWSIYKKDGSLFQKIAVD